MLGTMLGATYLRQFPHLRAKVRLAQLLDQFAHELTVVGRSGEDLVWGMDAPDDRPPVKLDDLLLVEGDHTPVAPQDVRIESVRFQNYRALKDTTLRLSGLTALVGQNGSGKTSLLDGLWRCSLLCTKKPDLVFTGPNAIERVRWRSSTNAIRLTVKGTSGYGYTYASGSHEQGTDVPFTVRAPGAKPYTTLSLLGTPLNLAFGGAVFLKLDARQLARPTYSPDVSPYLRRDGLYLPSVLSALREERPDRFDQLVDDVRTVIPAVRGIRTRRTEVEQWDADERGGSRHVLVGHGLEVDFGQTGWTPADQLSEGTLLTLGLHTILAQPSPPRMLLLDDADRGLHPDAQRRLVQQLKQLAERTCPIVFTTHSPYLLDELDPGAVRVVRPGQDGSCAVSLLTDHPKWQEWSADMSAGEFWQFAGDEWLEQA
jgi:ABC-type uncharacterized transport system ATPase subunit